MKMRRRIRFLGMVSDTSTQPTTSSSPPGGIPDATLSSSTHAPISTPPITSVPPSNTTLCPKVSESTTTNSPLANQENKVETVNNSVVLKNKRNSNEIKINFDSESSTHEPVPPNFWQQIKNRSKKGVPILCRLFTKFESAIEKLMATYLHVGGLSAHRAIQNYCTSKVSDASTESAPKSKLSRILSWMNNKLQKLTGKPKAKLEPTEVNKEEGISNISLYPNKLNIVVVSPKAGEIEDVESVIDTADSSDAVVDLQNELWDEMNEVIERNDEESADSNEKKKRSCFGFECFKRSQVADVKLNDLTQAIRQFEALNAEINTGNQVEDDSFLPSKSIDQTVPEVNVETKSQVNNFLQELNQRKRIELKIPRNVNQTEAGPTETGFLGVLNLNGLNLYIVSASGFALFAILLILLAYLWRRRRKKRGEKCSYEKIVFRRGGRLVESTDESGEVEEEILTYNTKPPMLEVKSDPKKSRKESYLSDLRPLRPKQKAKKVSNDSDGMESDEESIGLVRNVKATYKTSGVLCR